MPPSAPIKKKPQDNLLVGSLTPLVTLSGVCLIASAGLFTLDGQIATVWPAFLLVMAGPLVFPFILFPAGVMAGLWNALHGKHKSLVSIFAVASVAYLAFVMAATLCLMAVLATGLPVDSMGFFVEMFVVSGAVTPWAVFALRDRNNQLFILLIWAMAIAGSLALPLKISGTVGPVGYAAVAWAGIVVIMGVEHLRQNQIAAAQERARIKAANEAAAVAAAAAQPQAVAVDQTQDWQDNPPQNG